MRLVCAALCLSGVWCWADPFGESDLQIVNGTFPCFPKGRLNYSGDGAVEIRGAEREDCAFVVKTQTVRQRSEGRAGGNASVAAFVRGKQIGTLTVASLSLTAPDASMVEVELLVPITMIETIITTRTGDVRGSNLKGGAWLETGAGAVVADRIAGNVVVKTGGGPIEVGRVGGQLRCVSGGGMIHVRNAGGATECESSGGEIVVDEVVGTLHAVTAGGNIRIGRALSKVMAESVSGIIEVEEAAGLVTARTRGGMIQIGSSKGCTCVAGTGGIRLRSGDGPLMVSAGAGHILAELTEGAIQSDSILRSMSGDITILIPSNLAVSIKARNDSRGVGGRIVSEFSEFRVSSAMVAVTAEGSLNGGGPVLQVLASGGNIFLRRQR